MQTKRRRLTKSEWVILLVPVLLLVTWWVNGPGDAIVHRYIPVTIKISSSSIEALNFSPDGHLLAIGARNNSLRIWDVQQRQELWTVKAPVWQGWPYFSPDGTKVATLISDQNLIPDPDGGMANSYVQIYDARTGNPLMKLPVGKRGLDFYFLPDNQHMLISGNPLRLWDLQTQRVKRTVLRDFKPGYWSDYALSKDGRFAAVSTGRVIEKKTVIGPIKIFDILSGQLLCNLPTGRIENLFFTENSKYLNTVEDPFGPKGQIVRWQWRQKRLVFKRKISKLWRIRRAEKDKTLIYIEWVWDAGHNRFSSSKIHNLKTETGEKTWSVSLIGKANDLTVSRSLFCHTQGEDMPNHPSRAVLRDIKTGEILREFPNVNEVMLSPDGKTLATASGNVAKLWDISQLSK